MKEWTKAERQTTRKTPALPSCFFAPYVTRRCLRQKKKQIHMDLEQKGKSNIEKLISDPLNLH